MWSTEDVDVMPALISIAKVEILRAHVYPKNMINVPTSADSLYGVVVVSLRSVRKGLFRLVAGRGTLSRLLDNDTCSGSYAHASMFIVLLKSYMSPL